jgi:tetratricopeptide (TPR) repeat protein
MADEQQEKKPEFEVIRRAPPPDTGSPAAPAMIGLVLLLALGIGGYFVMQGGGDDTNGDDPTASPSPTQVVADEPAPDYVWEQIDFLTEQGSLQQALDAVESALEDYPNSSELKTRRAELREELGLGASDSAGASPARLIQDAKKQIGNSQWEAALDLLDAALDDDDENAEAYYLRGRCLGELGDTLQAIGSLEDAKALGYDEGKVNALVRQFQ